MPTQVTTESVVDDEVHVSEGTIPRRAAASWRSGRTYPAATSGLRSAYRDQVQRYLTHLERLLGDGPDARRQATVALSALVGAVLVARAVGDDALSEEILRDVRYAVKSTGRQVTGRRPGR
jgi:TetR/AcrR family transcriptional regulator, transcriptional repressor for nem operon